MGKYFKSTTAAHTMQVLSKTSKKQLGTRAYWVLAFCGAVAFLIWLEHQIASDEMPVADFEGGGNPATELRKLGNYTTEGFDILFTHIQDFAGKTVRQAIGFLGSLGIAGLALNSIAKPTYSRAKDFADPAATFQSKGRFFTCCGKNIRSSLSFMQQFTEDPYALLFPFIPLEAVDLEFDVTGDNGRRFKFDPIFAEEFTELITDLKNWEVIFGIALSFLTHFENSYTETGATYTFNDNGRGIYQWEGTGTRVVEIQVENINNPQFNNSQPQADGDIHTGLEDQTNYPQIAQHEVIKVIVERVLASEEKLENAIDFFISLTKIGNDVFEYAIAQFCLNPRHIRTEEKIDFISKLQAKLPNRVQFVRDTANRNSDTGSSSGSGHDEEANALINNNDQHRRYDGNENFELNPSQALKIYSLAFALRTDSLDYRRRIIAPFQWGVNEVAGWRMRSINQHTSIAPRAKYIMEFDLSLDNLTVGCSDIIESIGDDIYHLANPEDNGWGASIANCCEGFAAAIAGCFGNG